MPAAAPLIPIRRRSPGAKAAPAMPVKITTTMVTAAMPPPWVLSSTAMGVVTDLGRREAVILCLVLTGTPLEDYQRGGEMINMLLGPATAALALSIYRQREILRENFLPVIPQLLPG